MTYLEKYKQDHPEATYTCFGLPVDYDCPSDCGYEVRTFLRDCPFPGISCEDCWNRDMPEEKKGENMRTKVLETEPKKTKYIRIAVDEDTYSDLVNGAETTHIVVNAEDVVESEPVKCNEACENITPELVADLRTRLRALESENATLKECIVRMTLRMNELY